MQLKRAKKIPYWAKDLYPRADKAEIAYYKGERGEQGIAGPQGKIGYQGERGERGLRGVDGVDGIDGAPGINGADGIQGPQGERGKQGVKGDKGDTGATGPMPKHEIKKNQIRFEQSPGKWGEWISLVSIKQVMGGGGGSYINIAQAVNDLKALTMDGYTDYYGFETVDGSGQITLREVYSDAGKTNKLFTKTYTWSGGSPVTQVITNHKTGDVLTITATFDVNGNRETYAEVLT